MTEPIIVNVRPLPDIVIEEVPTPERLSHTEFVARWFEIIDLADESQYQAELAMLESLSI